MEWSNAIRKWLITAIIVHIVTLIIASLAGWCCRLKELDLGKKPLVTFLPQLSP